MLQNAYLLAKIGADTAENERNFAENWLRGGEVLRGTSQVGAPGFGKADRAVGLAPLDTNGYYSNKF